MAMEKTETECPVELWVSEEGGIGHPNEEVLSMLQSVRTHFHKFIFRPKNLYPNLPEFTSSFLSSLAPSTPKLFSQMTKCIELCLPLVELLGSGDNTSPDRLLRMLLPTSKAIWILASVEKEERKEHSHDQSAVWSSCQTSLSVEYYVRLKSGTILKTLNLDELEDFHCSVVLAQTDKRGEETNAKIRDFIQVFGWCKVLRENLQKLEVLPFSSFFVFLFTTFSLPRFFI